MKTILVATDFSAAALNASNYAQAMASVIQADILLLHVYSLPVNYNEIPVAMNVEILQQDAEKEINRIKDQLIRQADGKLHVTTEIRIGLFFPELKAVCEKIKPYVVITGSQGTTAAERVLLGSHAVQAMKHLEWPLITVPPAFKFSSIKKIGFACDFEKVVDTVPVDEIKKLVNDFNASLHILNTGKKKEFKPELIFESGLVQEMLGNLKPEYHFITSDNTDEAILDFAEKNEIDLLVVLPKRHSLLDQLVHKSHTKQFVLHSHVPVMALH